MSLSNGVSPGASMPLGATWDGSGTNFAIFSEHATGVELCLFDRDDPRVERRRVRVRSTTGPVWHCHVDSVGPGTPYGFRVHGPFRPGDGHRFNPAKLLVDPYAKAITDTVDWNAAVFGYRRGRDASEVKPDGRDDAAGVPKALVVDPAFDWGGDRRPQTPWGRTIIYEAHLKGLTILMPGVPDRLRGSYAGLGHPAAIEHLRRLGITAVELLPVHAFVDDEFLVRKGLRQYWGYNTLGFFAPEGRYSSAGDRGGQVPEFKAMVRSLHAAGIEVILDVVYNHTCEGGRLGPTLSFRGIDNRVYYRLFAKDPSHYDDVSGTGNTLNVAHPQVLKLVMDSLRYWVEEMHVDGFRFDLAPALARNPVEFDRASAFFGAVHQDPVLSSVKLIAEPWDIGDGGYQLGHFPDGWREWNDRYRDGVRRFWRGDRAMLGDLGFRLTGSADIFYASRRGPLSGIDFVTAHDGFTLRDLVSYDRKHNLANGELNRDGADHNHSWNNGVEGPSDDPVIADLRRRQIKNLIGTLLLSQGVPMLLAGDEIGRSQGGNNNAYCQDNPVGWIDWTAIDGEAAELLEFTRRAIGFRKASATMGRTAFYAGKRVPGTRLPDISWYRPDGKLLSRADWADPDARSIAFRMVAPCEGGLPEQVFVALNAAKEAVLFTVPRASAPGRQWQCVLTSDPALQSRRVLPGRSVRVRDRSLLVLRLSPDGKD